MTPQPAVLWQPQPKQALFMSRPEFEALYGGAAGGGKSDALLMESTRQVMDRNYRGILFRKTYPQLTELIDRSIDLFPKIHKGARFNDNKHCWTFRSGAKIFLANLFRDNDHHNYQGKAYQFVGFDELCHFLLKQYMYLMSRCRPRGQNQRCYIRATANPGGIGHGAVKARFQPSSMAYKRQYDMVEIDGQHFLRDRIFIPATVFDNKILLQNDPSYVATLAMLPPAERDALLYGDWDSFSGQVFQEWKNDSTHYRDMRWTHVIEPFEIPKTWRRFRSFDFGYSKPFSVGWWAMDNDGRLYRYRELYGWNGTADTGIKWEPTKIAQEIKAIEDKYERGNNIRGIADPSIWDKSRGESIAEMMEHYRVYFDKGDNERIAGKMQLHYRLSFDSSGRPMLYVFDTCKQFIRTLPDLVYDELDVEDVNTKQEDHIYDEARYMCMENPIAPRANLAIKRILDDPLNMQPPVRQYGFMHA